MNYAQIREMDISNSPNFSVSLWVSGCKFACPQCFNKEQQDFNYGKPYTSDIENTILSLLNKDYIYSLEILGGDPLCQNEEGLEQLIQLCEKTHKLNKKIWLWSGYTWEKLEKKFNEYQYTPFAPNADEWLLRWELINLCDVFVDGRFEYDKKDSNLYYRGSSNQQVIDVKQTLSTHTLTLYQPN